MTNEKTLTHLDVEIAAAATEVEWQATELKTSCRDLGERLIRLADSLPDAPISSLGEIQSQGTMIDARCATLVAKREHLASLKRIRDAERGWA